MKSSKSHEIDLPTDRDLYYHLELELHTQKDGKLPRTSSSKLVQNFKEYADLRNNFPPIPLRYEHLILSQDWFMHKSQRKRIVGRSWNNAEEAIHNYVMTISSLVKNRHDVLRLRDEAHTFHETVPSSVRLPVKTPEDSSIRRLQLPNPNQPKGALATTNPYFCSTVTDLSRVRSEPMFKDYDLSNTVDDREIDYELNRLSNVVESKVKDSAIFSRVKNSSMPDFKAGVGVLPQASRSRKLKPDFMYDTDEAPTKRRYSNPDISFLDGESCSEYNDTDALSFVRRHSSPEGSKTSPSMPNQAKTTANVFLTDPAIIYQNPINRHKNPLTRHSKTANSAPSFGPSVMLPSNNDKSHNELFQFVLQNSTMNRGSQGSGEPTDSNNDGMYNDGLLSPSNHYPCYNLQKQSNVADQKQPNYTLNMSFSSLDPSVRQSNNAISHNNLFFNSFNKMQNTTAKRGSPDNRSSPDSFDSTDNLKHDSMYKDGFLSPVSYPTFCLPAQQQNSAATVQPNFTFNRSVYRSNNDSSQGDHVFGDYNNTQKPLMNQDLKGSDSTNNGNDVMNNDRYSSPRISSASNFPDNKSNQPKPNRYSNEDLRKQIAHARAWVTQTYGKIDPAWVTQKNGHIKPSPDDTVPNANK